MHPDLVPLLTRLVATDSVNPSLVPGGAGEADVVGVILEWAARAGLEADRLEATAGRPNALVRARGAGDGATLLLVAHVDTVGVDGMADPFGARVAGNRLHGRGAYDMKGGLAAALLACREAAGLGLAGDVVVAAVADEEHASVGVQEVLRTVTADAAVVTEPTELTVAVAHKGFAWLEVEVAGRAAHGSRPHLGVDAIVKAGPILSALGALDAALAERDHPLLGAPSLHASLIQGGTEMSSYPERCRIGLERRTLPGESAADVETELAALLETCRRADPALEVTQRTLLVREPFAVDPDAPLVAALRSAAGEALGAEAGVCGVSYWADAAFVAAAGVPTVLFGPAGEGAHAAQEWVDLASCDAVLRTLVGLARRICG